MTASLVGYVIDFCVLATAITLASFGIWIIVNALMSDEGSDR